MSSQWDKKNKVPASCEHVHYCAVSSTSSVIHYHTIWLFDSNPFLSLRSSVALLSETLLSPFDESHHLLIFSDHLKPTHLMIDWRGENRQRRRVKSWTRSDHLGEHRSAEQSVCGAKTKRSEAEQSGAGANWPVSFLPARRYASADNSDRNVSVRLSVCHALVLCQNEES